MADAFEVLARRLVDLETITAALHKHRDNFAARDEFIAFANAVSAARRAYEDYLYADLKAQEKLATDELNQETAHGLAAH
jgi:hypothetical protein